MVRFNLLYALYILRVMGLTRVVIIFFIDSMYNISRKAGAPQ